MVTIFRNKNSQEDSKIQRFKDSKIQRLKDSLIKDLKKTVEITYCKPTESLLEAYCKPLKASCRLTVGFL
jgi:hypothetical protein